jgi:hypothetical protein
MRSRGRKTLSYLLAPFKATKKLLLVMLETGTRNLLGGSWLLSTPGRFVIYALACFGAVELCLYVFPPNSLDYLLGFSTVVFLTMIALHTLT